MKLTTGQAAILAAVGQLGLIVGKLTGDLVAPWWMVLAPLGIGAVTWVVLTGVILWAANRADSE